MPSKDVNRCSVTLVIRDMQTKIIMRYNLTPTRIDLSPPLGPPAGQAHSPACLIPVVQLILAEKLQMFVACNLQVQVNAEVCGEDALCCYR